MSHDHRFEPIYMYFKHSFTYALLMVIFFQMEMKVMLAKFFQHFDLHLDESECFEIGSRATIFPLCEIKCTVKPRQ